MFDLHIYSMGLAVLVSFAFAGWLVSICKRNVTLVDTLWGLFFLLATVIYVAQAPEAGSRDRIVLVMVAVWSLRLSVYLGWRNRGAAEDRRYQAIRKNNEPYFWFKSLYI
ncbi:MAG: DUF1295 domain-containing protein, partial [Methylococcales bacterium]